MGISKEMIHQSLGTSRAKFEEMRVKFEMNNKMTATGPLPSRCLIYYLPAHELIAAVLHYLVEKAQSRRKSTRIPS